MAASTLISVGALADSNVLAPERYDPRRIQNVEGEAVRLGELISIENPTQSLSQINGSGRYLVLDTGDSYSGVIRPRTYPVPGKDIRSAKKKVEEGDVIISRLRPYLRQVGLVDSGLISDEYGILVSTEYFVLRSMPGLKSIAWVLPFLLSNGVQDVLGRSQEGGHHPRFTKEALSNILVPLSVINNAGAYSDAVERGIGLIRSGLNQLHSMQNDYE